MSRHDAVVEWARGAQAFSDGRYSRSHRWTFDGGATVAASSSPAAVPAPMSDPAAVDPEEAFVAALSSCHMLWFLFLAQRRGLVVDAYRDRPEGDLEVQDGRAQITVVRLRPSVRWLGEGPTPEALADLHHEAHEACYLANSVRCRIECAPQAWEDAEHV